MSVCTLAKSTSTKIILTIYNLLLKIILEINFHGPTLSLIDTPKELQEQTFVAKRQSVTVFGAFRKHRFRP